MKTTIEGVEITPRIAAVIKKWCSNPDDSEAKGFYDGLVKIQDCISRELIEKRQDNPNFQSLLECLEIVIITKDDVYEFIPDKGGAV